jgi:plasmid stabilization system protein ParE
VSEDTYRVDLTPSSYADLLAVFEYIELQSPDNAAALVERVLAAVRELDILPTRHPVAGRSRRTGADVYKLVVDPLLVYYVVDHRRKLMTVRTVRHGARRQPKRFE